MTPTVHHDAPAIIWLTPPWVRAPTRPDHDGSARPDPTHLRSRPTRRRTVARPRPALYAGAVRRTAIRLLLSLGLVAVALSARGCFWATMQFESARSALTTSEVTDVSRYEEMRGRVVERVPADEAAVLPPSVPDGAANVRMRAIFSDRVTGLLLHAVLPPQNARAIAVDARSRAAFVVRGWADPHTGGVKESGEQVSWGWSRDTAESVIGTALPADIRMFVLKDTQTGAGLGDTFRGARVMLLVNEDEGVVVWDILHYHDPPPGGQ